MQPESNCFSPTVLCLPWSKPLSSQTSSAAVASFKKKRKINYLSTFTVFLLQCILNLSQSGPLKPKTEHDAPLFKIFQGLPITLQ